MDRGLIRYRFLPRAAALTEKRTLSLCDVEFLFQRAVDQFTDCKRQGLSNKAIKLT